MHTDAGRPAATGGNSIALLRSTRSIASDVRRGAAGNAPNVLGCSLPAGSPLPHPPPSLTQPARIHQTAIVVDGGAPEGRAIGLLLTATAKTSSLQHCRRSKNDVPRHNTHTPYFSPLDNNKVDAHSLRAIKCWANCGSRAF